MTWPPHITVATIVTQDDTYLMVEEQQLGRLVLNQPAGHLDPGESLVAGAARETLEETCWEVNIEGLVGACLYTPPAGDITYMRTTFFGTPQRHREDLQMDEDIIRALWLTYEEMLERTQDMRSPRVLETVEQYRRGHRYPLSFIYGGQGHAPGR